MIFVFVEGVKDIYVSFVRFVIEMDNFFRVFFVFNIFFYFYIKNIVVFCDFGFFVYFYILFVKKFVIV